jgi:bacterial/archaeal transporter family protein
MWLLLAVISSVLLGVYDLFKKTSLKENAVIPVLFFSTLSGAVIFIFLSLISNYFPSIAQHQVWFIPSSPWHDHLFYLIKSLIVGSSWILAYFAMKHLPISIASPIRASAPLWVLVGALIIFGERLTSLQWLGLCVTLVFYFLFSLLGRKEGINFRKNKWVVYMILSTNIGSISSLYDKYLIQHYPRMAVQAYSTIYMVFIFLPILLFLWYPRRKSTTTFEWRISIPLIGICLAFADFAYFYSISMSGSLISIISVIRRSNVIISFTAGCFLFSEKNFMQKALLILGILAGLVIIMLGTR